MPNLAAGKAATADSQCGPDNGADKAVNGRISGGSWNSWCSAGSSKWLKVDLGASAQIGTVVLYHAGAGGAAVQLNTRGFTVQTSVDGTTWTTVAVVTDNVKSVTTHAVNAQARYVRVLIAVPTSTDVQVARLFELEVYGPIQ